MAITKTNFIEYTRCKRYVALENIEKEKLLADVSFEEYQKEEYTSEVEELLGSMFEETEEGVLDKVNVVNQQLEAMLPYYKRVEEEAGILSEKLFGGRSIYAEKTKDQMSFEFLSHGIRYLCYVDIFNETKDATNIIEVKATTSKKYTDLVGNLKNGEKYSIFQKEGNIYRLKGEIPGYPLEQEMPIEKYEKERMKLFDRYKLGRYIHDLAIQRYIIEGEYLESHHEKALDKMHYYLAVLNQKYIFDGTYEKERPIYHTDFKGEEIITFFDFDEVTKEYLPIIHEERLQLEDNLRNMNASLCSLSDSCGYKSNTECKYFKAICGSKIPLKNSSLSYIRNGFGFTTEEGIKLKGLDLINAGYLHLLDIPQSWIHRETHRIQRDCTESHKKYINQKKIRKAIESLEYPIYHLDFETFPCPLPRFRGEWPYIQSPFEFSLHIESSPGVCDKIQDNVIFLAETLDDEREQLVKTLLKYIDPNKGTLFAQNVAFEKGRIKELATIFPKYKDDLMKIYHRGFDLMWILDNQKAFYESLGFSGKDLETMNFYDENLSGSFSIKKTLPVFSNLTYKDLVVKNGTEAIVEYANYKRMSKEELRLKKEALRIYCQQDTWAMVEILNALRKLVVEKVVN